MRGQSVQELCDAVTAQGRPLSAPALRNIELEHRDCKPDLIERIAKALDCDVRALVRVPLAEWGRMELVARPESPVKEAV